LVIVIAISRILLIIPIYHMNTEYLGTDGNTFGWKSFDKLRAGSGAPVSVLL
jgi:hypothetical protein